MIVTRSGVGAVLTLAVLGVSSTVSRPARADTAACIAASEAEVGLRKQQKLRAALDQLSVCSAPACPAEVKAECDRRAAELNAALPTIVLGATDAAGNDVSAVTVTVDGAPFATALDGRALPIDPGNHTLHFQAAGRAPIDKTIVAREGEKARRVSVVLGAAGATSAVAPVAGVAPVATVAPVEGAAPASPPPAAAQGPKTPSTWSTGKTVAVVSWGVGAVGIVVGALAGAKANSDASTQKTDCSSAGDCPNHAGAESAHSSSLSAGNLSTAMFVVGGVGAVAGTVLWLTAPKGGAEKAPAPAPVTTGLRFDPMVGPQGGGVMLSGRFQ
jgi:hypothetical protein